MMLQTFWILFQLNHVTRQIEEKIPNSRDNLGRTELAAMLN